MTATIQVNKRGSLTLPKALRKSLGIEKGGMVMVEDAPEGIILKPAVAFPVEMYDDKRIAEFERADQALARHLKPKARR